MVLLQVLRVGQSLRFTEDICFSFPNEIKPLTLSSPNSTAGKETATWTSQSNRRSLKSLIRFDLGDHSDP